MPNSSEVKLIPLTGGRHAIVDASQFEWLSKWSWFAQRGRNDVFYAARKTKTNKQKYMHREIVKAKRGQIVDHVDSDGLDNRIANLRLCSTAENIRNRRIDRRNKSGYKGVRFCEQTARWAATIVCNRKGVWLGRHDTAIAAARAYDEAARRLHGEFARLNFPNG